MRQQMENLSNMDFTGPEWDKLDSILFRSMFKSHAKLSPSEKDAVLRRIFVVPKDATHEEAMAAIAAKCKYKHANNSNK